MPYLLDTNVISELRKAHRADRNVKSRQATNPRSENWISVISLMEVKIGVARAENKDPEFAKVLDDWYYDQLLPAYASRTLQVDLVIAEQRARFEKTRTVSYSDALIAATARVNRMTLVTRNTSDFEGLGIQLINPWEHPLD